jgi:hypothetical protein
MEKYSPTRNTVSPNYHSGHHLIVDGFWSDEPIFAGARPLYSGHLTLVGTLI